MSIHVMPKRPYANDALAPSIDASTINFQHAKQDNANPTSIKKTATNAEELRTTPTETLLVDLSAVPEATREAVPISAGGHLDNSFCCLHLDQGKGGSPNRASTQSFDSSSPPYQALQQAVLTIGKRESESQSPPSHRVKRPFTLGWTRLGDESETTRSAKSHGAPSTVLCHSRSGAEHPRDIVVAYDGNCALCSNWVERLRRWDRKKRISFLSLHDPEVAQLMPCLTKEELMHELHLVDRHGRLYRGAGAVRYLSLRLPYMSWLAPILHLPFSLALWNWLYRKIAASRYGRSNVGSCAMNDRGDGPKETNGSFTQK